MIRPAFLLALALAGVVAGVPPQTGALEAWFEGERYRDRLPRELVEVSGLAVDDSGGLWAHDDEIGAVARIARDGGSIVERRVLGPDPVRGDFEGLAWDGSRFHLVTSTGTLVSFVPGGGPRVDRFAVRRTGAAPLCEVEGLDYHPATDRLVLACKTVYDDRWPDHLLLLEVARPGMADDLEADPLPVRPRLAVPGARLDEAGLDRRLSPSGLVRAPDDRGWLVVAARDDVLLHLGDDGRVLDHARLPSGHRQTEGLALEGLGLLTLADEGGRGRARLTRYLRPLDVTLR